MKTIFSYTNYRTFLKDHYSFYKKTEGLTYEAFAAKAGLQARNSLKLVMDGKKNLSNESIHAFGRALTLNFDELVYFECMVLMDQAQEPSIKAHYRSRLDNLRANRPEKLARANIKELLEQWYYPAILVAVSGETAEKAAERVTKLVGIPLNFATKAIAALEKSEVISIEDGKYVIGEKNLYLQDRRKISSSYTSYLRSQLNLSDRALDQAYMKRGKFYSQTFTVSSDNYSRYVAKVEESLDLLFQMSDSDQVEELVQINIQLFPFADVK